MSLPFRWSHPENAAEQGGETVSIKKGETVSLGNVKATFVKFDMGSHGMEAMAGGGGMSVGSVLELSSAQGKRNNNAGCGLHAAKRADVQACGVETPWCKCPACEHEYRHGVKTVDGNARGDPARFASAPGRSAGGRGEHKAVYRSCVVWHDTVVHWIDHLYASSETGSVAIEREIHNHTSFI